MAESKRTVVISGATKGLGRALSVAFGSVGHHVVGLYRSDTVSAAELEAEFETRHYSGVFIRQDVVSDRPWPDVEEAIASSRSRLITLISNANAPFTPKPLHLISGRELSDLFQVNVLGTLNLLKQVLPHMVRARAGVVVSILSSAVHDKPKGFSAYSASKAALQTLTESAAAEYSDRGVRFLCASPGFMDTALTRGWSPHLRSTMKATALDPSHVAAQIFALANDTSLPGRGETYSISEDVSGPIQV